MRALTGFIFDNERVIAGKARFVPLPNRQLKKARYQYQAAIR